MGKFKELYFKEDKDEFEEEFEVDETAYYEECDENEDDEEEINEKLIKKIVIRREKKSDGSLGSPKKMKKWKSDKPGYRVVPDPDSGRPKEVRMKTSEKIKRKKGQRKASIKRKAHSAQSGLKRKISMKKRTTMGLK